MLGIGLFKFDQTTNKLLINKGLVHLLAPFKKLLSKKNKKGFLELTYVYLMSEATSENPFFGYIPKEGETLRSVVKSYVGLEPSWTPDSDVEDAIKKYNELQDSITQTTRSIKAARKALSDTHESLSIIGIQNNQLIEQVKQLLTKKGLSSDSVQEINTCISIIIQNSKNLTGLIDGLEESFTRLENLDAKYKKNFVKAAMAKGSKEVSTYEDPNNYLDVNLLNI